MIRFWKWIIIFSLLNTLDYITTKYSLAAGAAEINKIAEYFIRKGLFLPYKMIGLILLGGFLYKIAKRNNQENKVTVSIIKIACIIYSLIVFNNCIVYTLHTLF